MYAHKNHINIVPTQNSVVMRLVNYLVIAFVLLLQACNTPATEEAMVEMHRNNDSLSRELSEKNEEVFLLRDSIRIARLRDSVQKNSPRY